MPSAPHSSSPPRHRPCLTVLLAIALTLAASGIFTPTQTTSAAQATEPPAPTQVTQPTQPPLPTQPPPPTQAPPTQVPPTQIPPTDPPLPTEVPPTEVPPTEQPTVAPTNTPDPFPTAPDAPPTNPPAQPSGPSQQQPVEPIDAGEIPITCAPLATEATPVVGAEGWDLQRCTVPLAFGSIDSLDIRAVSSDPGWRVILLDPEDVRTPGLLNASNNRTVVDDPSGATAEFLLGTQRTCSTLGATTLSFDFTGARAGTSAQSAAHGTFALDAPSMVTVTVDLADVDFDTTAGTFAVGWERDAPARCPWQITLMVPGAEGAAIMELAGPAGVAAVTTSGAVIITVPTGSTTGEVRLELAFPTGTPTAVGVEAQVRP